MKDNLTSSIAFWLAAEILPAFATTVTSASPVSVHKGPNRWQHREGFGLVPLGRAYFDAKKAAGKTPMEAMRALKLRLSNLVYARMIHDQNRRPVTDPGGHSGTTLQSSVTDLTPDIGPSDKPLPGPATNQPKPLAPARP